MGRKLELEKNENPEKACIEVIWKPKTGQIGKLKKEYEMILKRTLESICILTVNPNTTTSVIIQVANDDGVKMKAFAYLVFPNSVHSVLPEGSPSVQDLRLLSDKLNASLSLAFILDQELGN